ncbi:aminotransferase class I/II-fold pyridoxal phosphate-dependent enzyme [Paenibacillus sp. WLX1005]|uniref:aminotransferase class I/II-fold pyridoxal phosphate-dependent enzyme n=1 Tax=Paenibacillus sp. WLX1005 TaxID=3243766 RepID=UPI00398419E0
MIQSPEKQLNDILYQGQQEVYHMLSELGRRIYYVQEGILSQSAEAKRRATRYNATLGTATDQGEPMYLPVIREALPDLSAQDIFEYAPTAGKPELRQRWLDKMYREHPTLEGRTIGLPIVTTGLTHGLSLIADLFADEGDPVIVPDKIWENYRITFDVRRGSHQVEYPIFNHDGGYNTEGLRTAIQSQHSHGKAIVVLNFPNNPTGYTLLAEEKEEIVRTLQEAADTGMHLVVLIDDAYFGLFYEDSIHESLFSTLAGLHPSILPIRIDGATKEDYATGLRVGFITYAAQSNEVLTALEQKTMGLIRATLSSGPHPSQSLLLRALQSPLYIEQKEINRQILYRRAHQAKQLLQQEHYQQVWSLYPFNSGYFLCLRLHHVQAETLRRHLLDHYQIGIIALNEQDIRLAVPCIEEKDWRELLDLLYRAVQELEQSSR